MIGDRVSVDVNVVKFVKVSDEIPKVERFVGGIITIKNGGESQTTNIPDNSIVDYGNGMYGIIID